MNVAYTPAKTIFLISFLLFASSGWAATLDVYTLKDISFPNVYAGNNVFANVTIDNNLFLTNPQPGEMVTTTMRDSKGVSVAAWGVRTFSLPDFSSGEIQTMQIDIQLANSTPFLNEGETYTLYATIEPFAGETETSNNSAFKTFTVLATPQSYSIPDFPAWMSVLVFSIIFGWLFFSAKKGRSI